MEIQLYPQRPGSQSATRPSSQGPRGKSLLHTSAISKASLLDQQGHSITLIGESESDMGAKFFIREYPSPADFFSVEIIITVTEQKWCIFVPIDALVAHLLHCWGALPKYDRTKKMGVWIVKCTVMEFQDGRIVGSQFDQNAFAHICENELRRLLHNMAVRIQARIRGVLSREAQRKAPPPLIKYDRSFYTTSAIAKMRPKVPYTKQSSLEEAIPRTSCHNKDDGSIERRPRITGSASPRRVLPSRSELDNGTGSSDKRVISTAPLRRHHKKGGENRLGNRLGEPNSATLGYGWPDSLIAPRSVTAGQSPRRRTSRQLSPRGDLRNMHFSRPPGSPSQWPTKRSPRNRDVQTHFHGTRSHRNAKTSGVTKAAAASTRLSSHTSQPCCVQEKLCDVMALYVSAPGPYQHYNFGSIDSSVGSSISHMYDELQSQQVYENDGDMDAAGSHFPDVHAGRQSDLSMEYVDLFDMSSSSSRISPFKTSREYRSRSPTWEHERVRGHVQGHPENGPMGDFAVDLFGSLRYMDLLEDKSTMTDCLLTESIMCSKSEANSCHITRVNSASENMDSGRQVEISSALGDVSIIVDGSAATSAPIYVLHDGDVLDSYDPSLWNGSVADSIYWPNEASLASRRSMIGLGGASKSSRVDVDKDMSTESAGRHTSAVATPDESGDYKLLVDYRDASQRKGWLCILRFLTSYALLFQQRRKRKILKRNMQVLVEESDMREAMQLSVQTGDVELAKQTIRRIQSIILSHTKGHSVITSTFNPTSLSNLSLIVEMVFAFISISDIAEVAIDILVKICSISNIGDLPEVFGSSGALNLIVTMWARHSQSNSLDTARTIMLLRVSNKLTEESNRNRLRLFSIQNCNILSKLILKYIDSNPKMLERFLRLICKTGVHDHTVMEKYCRSQLYPTIKYGISALTHHRAVFQILCKGVTVLCSAGHTATQAYFGSSELCIMYLHILKQNKHDMDTYRCMVSVVISICARHAQNMANLANCQFPEFLMSVLSDDTIDGEVIRCTISLLFHLSSHEPLKDGLIAMGLDTLLNDVGRRYDIKRSISALNKHGYEGSLSSSPTAAATVIEVVQTTEFPPVDSAATITVDRALRECDTAPSHGSPTKTTHLDDIVSQVTLDEMAQLHIEDSPLRILSLAKPRARSLDNVLSVPSAVKNPFAQTFFHSGESEMGVAVGKNMDGTTSVGGKSEPQTMETQVVSATPSDIASSSAASGDCNEHEMQCDKGQQVDQETIHISSTAAATVGTIIKTASFCHMSGLVGTHDDLTSTPHVAEQMLADDHEQMEGDLSATAIVRHVIRTASDTFFEELLSSATGMEGKPAEVWIAEEDATCPPSLVICDYDCGDDDDDAGDTVNIHRPHQSDKNPKNDHAAITATKSRDGDGAVSPTYPACEKGEYILDSLIQAVKLADDKLAVKALRGIRHIMEKIQGSSVSETMNAIVTVAPATATGSLSQCTLIELNVLKEITHNPALVLPVLNAFSQSTGVQHIGVWILRNIVCSLDDIATAMVDGGLCNILFSSLQSHVRNEEIFAQTIDYVSYVASKCPTLCSAVGSIENCKVVTDVMSRLVVSNAKLMCACCMLTRILAMKHADIVCQSGMAGLIVKFLIVNKHDQEIVHLCGETILALTETNSSMALKYLANHKHLRLYVHIIKVNQKKPHIVNVMSNVVAMMCAHKNSYNIAAEAEKSGMIIDLINVLRHSLTSDHEAAVHVLHTSLLLILHISRHIASVAKMLKTGGGEDLLRGLLSYGHLDHCHAEAIRDVASAGLQHMSTPQSRDRQNEGRAGVTMGVLFDTDKIYSYTRQYNHSVSALDFIDYSIDHGPFRNHPVNDIPEEQSPAAIAPTPTPSPRNCGGSMTTLMCLPNHTEEVVSVYAQHDQQSVPIHSATSEGIGSSVSSSSAVAGTEEVALDEAEMRRGCIESPSVHLQNSLSSSLHVSEGANDESFRGSGSVTLKHIGDNSSTYGDDFDESIPTTLSSLSPVRKNLSGNSLLRILRTSTDIELLVVNMQHSVATTDRVLALNVLNRIAQILVALSMDTAPADGNHPLIRILIERQSLLTDYMMYMTKDKDVQLATTSVLHRLPLTPQDMERVVAEGMLGMIYAVLTEHQVNPDVYVSWMKFGTKLIKHSAINRIAAGKDNLCQTIYLLLHAVLANKRMTLATLSYIYAMCDDCVKNQGLFARTGLGSTVLKFLIEYKKDGDVVKKCIKVVDSLCAGNVELNLKMLASQRHLRLYIKIIRYNAANTFVVQAICGLLITICAGTSPYVLTELRSGSDTVVKDMISVLVDATQGTACDDGAVQALLAVLSHWTHNVRSLHTALVQSQEFVGSLEQLSSPRWNDVSVDIASELLRYYEVYR